MTTPSGIAPATFPHEELTRIEGAPTYLTLRNLKREILANAMSVHSTRGSGILGHAVIVIGVAEYNNVANAPGQNNNDWTAIAHPGPHPNYGANANATQIARIQGQYERDIKEFITFSNTANALKQQLLAAIDSMYICSLQDPMYGYARVTVHDILEHLDNTYGALDQVELNKNMQTLEEPWEPTESMEPLWHRAVVAQQVAQAGADPITPATLLRKFHQVLTNTGVFTLDLRDWDKKPDADKTWNNFRAHFTAANKERIKTATARDLHAAYAADGNRERATTSTTGTSTTITRTIGTTWAYCWTH